MSLTTYSCEEFVEILSSKAPVPGGGGASALVGAVGVALGNMVGSLTVGKKKYADVEADMIVLKKKAVNKADEIHGVLLFRPLPKHLNEEKIINSLDISKDVDGITDGSMVGVYAGKKQGYPPCTPQSCMEILEYYGIDCIGKKVIVIGRSLVVGKPVSMMLMNHTCSRRSRECYDFCISWTCSGSCNEKRR